MKPDIKLLYHTALRAQEATMLHYTDSPESSIRGFCTNDLAMADTYGMCANPNKSVRHKIGKTYLVKFGDPTVTTATYLGTLVMPNGWLLGYHLSENFGVDESQVGYVKELCVFKQGKELLFYDASSVEFLTKVR